MTIYDMVHSLTFEYALPDHLTRTLLATIAMEEITEAAATYQTEVIRDYPEAQMF